MYILLTSAGKFPAFFLSFIESFTMINASNIVAPDFAWRYINLVAHESVNKALRKNSKAFLKLLKRIPRKKRNYAYAQGKWTLKEVLQHIIDAERVFTLRALWFARKDGSPLPGFDENVWAASAKPSDRHWNDIAAEFKNLRIATELLFKSFNEEEMNAHGLANNNMTSVTAIGYMCSGHVAHHINIIKERYL